MHQQEFFPKEENSLTAAQAQITPRQLIRALNHLETAQGQNAQTQVNTLSVGDAIQELGLDISPEKLLSAVSQTQDELESKPLLGANRLRQKQLGLKLIGAFAVGACLLFAATNLANIVVDHERESNATITYSQFTQALQQGHVSSVRVGFGYVEGNLDTNTPFIVKTAQDPITHDRIVRLLNRNHVEILEQESLQ